MRSPTVYRTIAIALTLFASAALEARSPFSLVRFQRDKDVARSSNLLTEDNGPWMIFAASFAGPGAEREARTLVNELRSRFRLEAYLHRQRYDFTDTVKGKGFNRLGGPKIMKYSSDYEFEEFAVLIGNYQSLDDPALQKHLQHIKQAKPDCLTPGGEKQSSTQRFAGLRALQKRLKGEDDATRGPMSKAFATRNPALPPLTQSEGMLDDLIVDMNRGRKHTLLDCPGRYTVRVASFRGEVVIDQRKVQELQNQKNFQSKLVEAGEKAEELTDLLRHKGIEAYVFHDRHESIVTVGSFQEIGKKQPDGVIDLQPAVAKIIETYGPSKKRVSASSQVALAAIQPKALKHRGESYIFEVAPRPIFVPRRSIAADYVR